jgi:hypothetical protein
MVAVCAQAIACYDHHCEGRSGGVSSVPGKHKVPFENAAATREIRGVIGQQLKAHYDLAERIPRDRRPRRGQYHRLTHKRCSQINLWVSRLTWQQVCACLLFS